MHRLSAALVVATMVALAPACGEDGSSVATRGTGLPPETTEVTVATTTSTTSAATTTVVRPTTTKPAPATTRVPATTPTSPPTTTAGARTVALGETFTIEVGQSVSVTGAGLTLTFAAVVSDNRCPPGVMCIQAGNGVISVSVARAGVAPANLTLNTTEGPTSARYGTNTVELVQLFRGPVARLRVT